jgi:hypothetical protein
VVDKDNLIAEVYNEDGKLKLFVIENMEKLISLVKLWDFENNNKVKYIHFKDALSSSLFDLNPSYSNKLVTLAVKYLVADKTRIQDQSYLDYLNFFSQFV